MGKGKTSTKAAQKKKERIELQKKMDARIAIVQTANAQDDPLSNLPSFKKFSKNGMSVNLQTIRAPQLGSDLENKLFDLITRNMKAMYEQSNWGWNPVNKRKEMFEDNAWYLLATDEENGHLLGFSHFRFDMDFDDEVLYVYEIQLEEKVQRKGLGRFMLQVLELLCFKADMRKIMCTVFKHNPSAQAFFRSVMKFETDETSPMDDVYEQFDYEILSKFNKRKLAQEQSQENSSQAANALEAKC